jgi:hypothetical protein
VICDSQDIETPFKHILYENKVAKFFWRTKKIASACAAAAAAAVVVTAAAAAAAMTAVLWRRRQHGDGGGMTAAWWAARRQHGSGGRIASARGGGSNSAVSLWRGSSCGANLFNKSRQDPTRERAPLPCFVSFKRILISTQEANVVHFCADP